MPSGDVDGFGGGREPVGALVQEVVVSAPEGQVVASVDHLLEAVRDVVEVLAEVRPDGRDRVEAEEALVSVMQ